MPGAQLGAGLFVRVQQGEPHLGQLNYRLGIEESNRHGLLHQGATLKVLVACQAIQLEGSAIGGRGFVEFAEFKQEIGLVLMK